MTEKRKSLTGPQFAHGLVEQAEKLHRTFSQLSKDKKRESKESHEKRRSLAETPDPRVVDKKEHHRSKRPESYHAGMRDSYQSQNRDSRQGDNRGSHPSLRRESNSSKRRESYHGESIMTGRNSEEISRSPPRAARPAKTRANGSAPITGLELPPAFKRKDAIGVTVDGGPWELSAVRPANRDAGKRQPVTKGLSKTATAPTSQGNAASSHRHELPHLKRNEGSQNSLNSNSSSHHIPRRPVGSKNGSFSRSQLSNTQQFTHPTPAATEPVNMPGKKRGFFGRSKKPSHGKSDSSLAKPSSRDNSATRASDAEETKQHDEHQSKLASKERKEAHVREESTSNLLKGFKTQTAKAARGVERAGKGIFRKREQPKAVQPPIDYSKYVLLILTLPLVDQARATRIVKRIEDSKDKTEFWMPALPWRCIDYLNYNGIESEGLYRIPGSMSEVRMWKARFDKELDINLFEEKELYDINAIGSLFKAWLRDLPDDVFPQKDQYYFSHKYHKETKCPDELKQYLSHLHPYHYYLLFAVTCHLSLLFAFEEQNKMSFQNLYVCFGPALRLNGDCFKWLVGDWRSCFEGCVGEPEAIEEEYRYLQYDTIPVEGEHDPAGESGEDREGDRNSRGSGSRNSRGSSSRNSRGSGSRNSRGSGSQNSRGSKFEGARLPMEIPIPRKSHPSPVPQLATLPGIGPPPGSKEYELMRLQEEVDHMSIQDLSRLKHFHKRMEILDKYDGPDGEYETTRYEDPEEGIPYHLRHSRLSATWTTQKFEDLAPRSRAGAHQTQHMEQGDPSNYKSRNGERSIHRLHPRSPERTGSSPEAHARSAHSSRSAGSRSSEARNLQSRGGAGNGRLREEAWPRYQGPPEQNEPRVPRAPSQDEFFRRNAPDGGNARFHTRYGNETGPPLAGRYGYDGHDESDSSFSYEGHTRLEDRVDPSNSQRFLRNPSVPSSPDGNRVGSGSGPSTAGPLRLGGGHGRSASQLPELDLPQPISPTFATRRGS